jgi:bifunctional non-homologous end joining protein LigD
MPAFAFPMPMLATPGSKPFTSPDWIFEIKWDGYRCMVLVDHGEVRMRSKNGADCTGWYPEVARSLASLPGGPHLIDGEACVLDDVGRADFEKLHARARRRCWHKGADQVTLMAFDLLVHDGVDVMGRPLVKRKAGLQQLLADVPKRTVLYVGDFPADAELFSQVVLGAKLEGFVAKRRASPYQPGIVSQDWLKLKRAGWSDGRSWQPR